MNINANKLPKEITTATVKVSFKERIAADRVKKDAIKAAKKQAIIDAHAAKKQAIIDAHAAKEAERQAKRDMELEELNDPNPFDINKTYFKQASEDLKIAMMIPNSMF